MDRPKYSSRFSHPKVAREFAKADKYESNEDRYSRTLRCFYKEITVSEGLVITTYIEVCDRPFQCILLRILIFNLLL